MSDDPPHKESRMNRRILLAVLVLVLASLACGRQLAKWELTPGAITPPANDLTLYVCVTPEEGARFTIGRAS